MIDLKDNIARVQERIAEACRRAGRRPEDVKLVAVSKTVPPDRIRAVYDAGLRDLGEEQAKSGVSEQDVLPLAEQVGRLATLEVRGLMVLPPFFEDPEQARPF